MGFPARLRAVAATMVAAAAVVACGGGGEEVVPAPISWLSPAPRPVDRELHATISVGVLAEAADPVVSKEAVRAGDRVEVTVRVRQRVPGSREAIAGTVRTIAVTIPLAEPLGDATVYDMSSGSPNPVSVLGG
ncbi:hypothetical protein ACOBQX_23035 [Actinokineospora sp. G85]|uniref:hypothetical protein n=1 Tax=Actinokineospora sp. G85 TaxID=3406626 RepID=UPI003C7157CB